MCTLSDFHISSGKLDNLQASFLSCIKEWEFNAITSSESEALLEAVTCPPFQLKQAQQEKKKTGYYVCINLADKEITLSLMTWIFRVRFILHMPTIN